MFTISPIAVAALKVGERKSPSGSIGRARLDSIATNAAPATAASAKPPNTAGSPKPLLPPSIVAPASAISATTAASCPAMSTPRPVERGVSAAHRAVRKIPARPIGALMKKIDRQPSVAVSSPPRSGPPASAALAPAAHRPTARARSAGSG